jgi:ubiquinone/menaquinone biosynthesis C-methylase UbiE
MTKNERHLDIRINYDRLSRWYDSFSASERGISRIGLEMLNIRPGEKVVEIGFGTGHALIELAYSVEKTGSVSGIDLSPGMLAIASRRVQHSGMGNRISLQLGDATRLPFPDNQFQAAFMSFTLELFDNSEIPVVLAECQRVLQSGARLGIVSLAKKVARAVEIYEWFHIHFQKVIDCRPISVYHFLEGSGFEVDQSIEANLWGLPVDVIVARKL